MSLKTKYNSASMQTFIRRLQSLYVISLTLVALLAVVSHFIFDHNINIHKADALLINESGRQRMLSQQLALNSLKLVTIEPQNRETIRTQLIAAIQTMSDGHAMLSTVSDLSESHSALYFGPGDNLNQRIEDYLAAVRRLASAPETMLTQDNPDLNYILATSASLLELLDRGVSFYQQRSVDHLQQLRTANVIRIVVIFTILGAEGWFIVRPFINRLRNKTEELEDEVIAYQRAEQEINEKQNFIERITETVPDIVYVFDLVEHRNVYSNREIAQILGYSVEEIQAMGSNLLPTIIHPDDLNRIYAHYQKCSLLGSNEIAEIEYRSRNANGEWRWLYSRETIFNWDEDGKPRQILGIATDITEEKKIQEKLAEERNILRTMIDAVPHLIWMKDAQARFVLVNRLSLTDQQLTSQDAILGKTDFDIHPPELAQKYFEDDQKVLRAGQSLEDIEELNINVRGETRWMLTTKVPLRDSQGRVTGLVGISRDITERKMMREKLAEERNLLRTLIDNIPDFIYIKDNHSRYLLNNTSHLHSVGAATQADTLGKSDFELFPPELAAQYYADEQALVRTGEPIFNQEEISVGEQRNRIWALSTKVPLRNSAGEVMGIIGITRDITEHKRMEEKLAEERNLLRTLIDQLPDYIFVKDIEGRYLLTNVAHARAVQVDNPDDMIGKTAFDFWMPELAAQYDADDRTVMQSGNALINQERVTVNASGEQIWVSTTKVPLYDQYGAVTGIVGLSRDMSDSKRAEQQARELEVEKERVQMLADFITSTSHDLKTPLTIISGSVYILAKSYKPEQREAKQLVIEQQIRRMTDLIDQLHTMAHLDRTQGLNLNPFDLNALMYDLSATVRKVTDQKNIQFTCEVQSPLPMLRGDSHYLYQGLSYILDNAMRYTPEGGAITLDTSYDGSNLLIAVQDTGIGIPEEDLPHIFDRFYKVDKARKPENGGAGLGLTMAKRIIEIHGGEIQVESQLSVGTTVKVILPSADMTIAT